MSAVSPTRTSAPGAHWKPASRRRVRALADRLRAVYGRPLAVPHERPLDELVLTVLSQSTNDRNRDVAFLRLRARFGADEVDWAGVRDAPREAVEQAIRPGGISRVKSARIQAILGALAERGENANSSLDWMRDAPVGEARAHLLELPGVGRKTAACVLLFAFGRREVPVDTHVSRVGGRLGLLASAAPLDQQHDQMLALTPPGRELELHVNLLRHGRRTCHARAPLCAECALARMCPSRRLFSAAAATASQPRGRTAKAITA
jgi:endonuclease III